jgi:beta-glucosidase
LAATDTPVIEVVVSGRPLVLGDAAEPDALIAAWLPGTEGGTAIADALFGAVNPGGRLPVSWPKALGNEPVHYQQLPGTNYGPDSGYAPAYEFGAGLSYTTFTTGAVELDRARARPGDTVKVTVPVANTGGRAGDLVVPVYASQPVSEVLVPPRRLVGFARVHLAAGERGSVRIAVPLDRLAVTPGDIAATGRPRVAPGEYLFRVGEASAALTVR